MLKLPCLFWLSICQKEQIVRQDHYTDKDGAIRNIENGPEMEINEIYYLAMLEAVQEIPYSSSQLHTQARSDKGLIGGETPVVYQDGNDDDNGNNGEKQPTFGE